MSTSRRTQGVYGQKRPFGPNGERLCYNCRGPLPKGKPYNCSPKCSDEWRMRTSPSYLRHCVWQRDKGVCAKCGIDSVAGKVHPNGSPLKNSARGTGELWQADHIVPVVEGGGECTLSNLRTLCSDCHKEETRKLRGRLKQKRVEAKPLPLLEGL